MSSLHGVRLLQREVHSTQYSMLLETPCQEPVQPPQGLVGMLSRTPGANKKTYSMLPAPLQYCLYIYTHTHIYSSILGVIAYALI